MTISGISNIQRVAFCISPALAVVLCIAQALAPAPAYAQPSIDFVEGPISHGQTVRLVGSSFESKSNPTPIVFDKFDDSGQSGDLIKNIDTFWDTYSDNPDHQKPALSDLHPRFPGAGLNAKIYMDRENYQNDHIYKNKIFDQKIFASFWVRFDPGSPDTHDGQIKLFRINKSTEPNQGPWIYFRDHKGPAYTLHRYGPDGADESTSWYGHGLPAYEWTQITVQMDQGTVGNNDGSLRIWHNGKLEISEDNLNFLIHPDFRFESIRLGEYVGNDSPLVANEHFDDIYLDDTWARVEIGNNPDYGSCTHREMQYPTAWSATDINVVLNRGGLPSNQDAYLFVVDRSGNASPGKKISWSDNSPIEGPGQPGRPVLVAGS